MNEQEELERDQKWLGKVRVVDLVDMSYGTFDLSQGSTNEWWEQVKEIPMTFLELEKFSDEDLWNELKRRCVFQVLGRPQPLNGVFPKGMQDLCEDYVNEVWSKGYEHGADLKQYIFANAVESVFGKDIFEKLNKRNDEITNDR